MPRRIRLHPYLTEHELHERYFHAHNPIERSRWQFLWLLARGLTATAIARVTGYSAYWVGQPERLRSATLSSWWPQQIKRRQGPRR